MRQKHKKQRPGSFDILATPSHVHRDQSRGRGDDRWATDILDGYTSTEWWHDQAATDLQREALKRRGYDPPLSLTKGEAAHVLDRPTPRQRRLPEERGLWFHGMMFAQAREVIDRLAQEERWR